MLGLPGNPVGETGPVVKPFYPDEHRTLLVVLGLALAWCLYLWWPSFKRWGKR